MPGTLLAGRARTPRRKACPRLRRVGMPCSARKCGHTPEITLTRKTLALSPQPGIMPAIS
jgi:hypothetical protein